MKDAFPSREPSRPGTGSRFAVFVDAGYLLAAGGWATVGSYRRSEVVARIADLVSWLQAQTTAHAGGRELLRVYWYDAAPRKEPTTEQQEVARQPDTKLRLGSLSRFGEQKGVDALLLADMMDLTLGRGVDLAFLISGDEDHVEAVRRIQSAGIRLHLWGVDSPKNTVSVELRREADRFRLLKGAELQPFFAGTKVEEPSQVQAELEPPAVRPTWMDLPMEGSVAGPPVTVNRTQPVTYADVDPERAVDVGRRFARRWLPTASASDLDEIRSSRRPSIPYQIDARLLTTSWRDLDVSPEDQLDYDTRVALRNGFWDEFEQAEIARS
jgi:uncharacterized LabA/DUF88 family protein